MKEGRKPEYLEEKQQQQQQQPDDELQKNARYQSRKIEAPAETQTRPVALEAHTG